MATAEFAGRVLSSTVDPTPTDVIGPHTVMYPTSAADVAVALKLIKDAQRDLLIRSGTPSDVRDPVDGTGAVVLNLRRLDGIDINGTAVKVGPAVTVEELSEVLSAKKLFLPLSATSIQSILDNVQSTDPGYMTRSAGPLRDYVDEVEFARPDGTVHTATEAGDNYLLDEVIANEDDSVITSIVFGALAEEAASRFWIANFFMRYNGRAFRRLVRTVFAHPQEVPVDVDLVVKAAHGNYGIPYVTVTASGRSDEAARQKVVDMIKDLVNADALRTPELDAPVVLSVGVKVVEAVRAFGDLGSYSRGLTSSKHVRDVEIRDFPRFSSMYSHVVDFGLGTAEGGIVHYSDIFMLSSLSLTEDNRVHASLYLFAPDELTPQESWLYRRLNRLLPVVPSVGQRISFIEEPETDVLASASYLSAPPPTIANDPKELAKRRVTAIIPGFQGELFTPADGVAYTRSAHVYASSSYPPETTTPAIVAYPMGILDIKLAIQYARSHDLRVVSRSGGHQYSALSTGTSDAIVLSMDHFQDIKIEGGNQATLGAGCRLKDIAKAFMRNGVTIPHGECPVVCIGGHMQSGGFGHLLRSFGLALDYVRAFHIVLANGTDQTVNRPKDDTERGLFWAVCGGGPMSWGVLTSITFHAVMDVDHPLSRGQMSIRLWQKDIFRALMKNVQKWSQKIASNSPDLLPDVDMMCTAISTDIPDGLRRGYLKGIILLELVHGNIKGAGAEGEAANAQAAELFNEIRASTDAERGWFNLPITLYNRNLPLSWISRSFVRTYGTTEDGREFKYPYEKRLNATFEGISDGFVNGFVDLVDDTISSDGVRLVFQNGFGGAAYRNSENRKYTSLPRRDVVWNVVYDVFYLPGFKKAALDLQERMKDLLVAEFPEGESVRFTWGSYGDTNINEVKDFYYDTPALYAQLQGVKTKYDPKNVFRTEFTVQPTASTKN